MDFGYRNVYYKKTKSTYPNMKHEKSGSHYSKLGLASGIVHLGTNAANKVIKNGNKVYVGDKVKQFAKHRKPLRSKTKLVGRGKADTDEFNSGIAQQKGRYVLFEKVPKQMMNGGGSYQYSYTYQNRVVSPSGLDSVSDLFAIGTVNQWITSTTLPITGSQSNKRWFDFNPAQLATGSSVYASTTPANDKFCLRNSDIRLDFANQESLPVLCRLFVFKCVQSTNNSPQTAWLDNLVSDQMGAPVANLPGSGTTGAPLSNFGIAFPYSVPTNNKGFRKLWKMIEVKQFHMASGAFHSIHMKGVHNDLGDANVLRELATTYRKGSVSFLLTTLGSPAKDTTAGAANEISWGPSTVALCAAIRLTFKAVKATTNRFNGQLMQFNTPANASTMTYLNFNQASAAPTQA